jgi:hypothetical protein
MIPRVVLALALVVLTATPALPQSRTQIDITDNVLLLGRNAGAAVAIATGGTIDTTGMSIRRLTNGLAVTGVILEAGTKAGQVVVIVNAGSGTITFATSGTSNVAYGTSAVIQAGAAAMFVWDDVSSLWFPLNP